MHGYYISQTRNSKKGLYACAVFKQLEHAQDVSINSPNNASSEVIIILYVYKNRIF